jgi:hypothetical protein
MIRYSVAKRYLTVHLQREYVNTNGYNTLTAHTKEDLTGRIETTMKDEPEATRIQFVNPYD